jgi:hypothetical protein
MSDVYDLAVWCHLCNAPHSTCEPIDLRFRCITCAATIEYDDECPCDGEHCAEHCPVAQR